MFVIPIGLARATDSPLAEAEESTRPANLDQSGEAL
jgi:hypothetical protein